MQDNYGNKKKRKRKRKKQHLLDYLERLQQEGTEIYMDGEAMSAGEVMRRTVEEECMYMADYVLEKSGKIKQVRFDKVEL